MENNYTDKIRSWILNRSAFIRAQFTGAQKGADMAWIKVVVRPVELGGEVYLQFSFFDEKKDISKNYTFEEASARIDEVLALPFRNIFIESATGTLQVNISKKGKALVNERKSTALTVVDLSHNREKNRLLSAENAKPFLEAVGILTKDGRIKADMQRKYTQINEFLRLVDETDALKTFTGKPVHVVDFGCGNAYLTFAVYYYLHEILKLDAHVTGVDIKADLIERLAENPVVALHACDTATDDALAKGIRWESKIIVCAPCCQHDLQVQMAQAPAPTPLASVLSHGILFERMGDILTDTFRATLLRIMGYRTDVTQFVPIEHTAKNLMIRSVKISPPGKNPRWVEEYRNLKSFWQVTPYLEKILGGNYIQYL